MIHTCDKTCPGGGNKGKCPYYSLSEILALINEGVLVRNTDRDNEPGWALRQMPLIMTLKRAQALLDQTSNPQPGERSKYL